MAQASVIQFRNFCSIDGGVTCTLCFMYPHRKNSSRFRSDDRACHSTQSPYPYGMLLKYISNVRDTLCGGCRRVGTIHSKSPLTEIPLNNIQSV
ncbi:hypothetical protein TNCV_2247881 [Trichonephila clavipes]|nr:hypothetical protein TNCV_2247881 [Trichonephila clavipes]